MHNSLNKKSSIYVAGHTGMAGSAILYKLACEGYAGLLVKESTSLDLRRQSDTEDFFRTFRPQKVILAAGKVGGIHANDTYRGDFIYDNLMIQANIISCCKEFGVERLILLASSCMYPKHAKQPMRETDLLTGPFEPTNEPYAVAKIAGYKMGEAFMHQYGLRVTTLIPSNLYGPGDNYHPENSHVVAALIRKFTEARIKNAPQVTVWGSGAPLREFMHVDDLADACLFLLEKDVDGVFNVGTRNEISISGLAVAISQFCGYEGKIVFDTTMPDGAPRKIMDSSPIADMGWAPKINLFDGLKETCENYLKNI